MLDGQFAIHYWVRRAEDDHELTEFERTVLLPGGYLDTDEPADGVDTDDLVRAGDHRRAAGHGLSQPGSNASRRAIPAQAAAP